MLLLAALCHDLVDERDNLLVHFMSLIDGLDHHLSSGTSLAPASIMMTFSLVEATVSARSDTYLLCLSRVDNELTVNQTDLGRGTRDLSNGISEIAGCDGGTQHGCQLRAAVRIYGHYDVVKGNVVAVILREQRTHGTVDNAGGQDSVLRCLALPLVETSRDLSY